MWQIFACFSTRPAMKRGHFISLFPSNNIALFYPLLLHKPMYVCTFRENRIEFHQRVLRGQGGKEVSYYVDGGLVGGVGVGAKEGGSRTRVDDGMGGAF